MARYRYLIAVTIFALIAGWLFAFAILANPVTIIHERSIGRCPAGATFRPDVMCYSVESVP
jgi:hypothetical protein